MQLNLYDNSDFDRGASKAKEGLWMLVKCVFFLNPFPWPSKVRTTLLKMFGARLGKDIVIRSGVNITFPWKVKMGDRIWIGDDVVILSLAEVELGHDVVLSQQCYLCTGSHNSRKETFDLITQPIKLENSVWIGARAFVGPGVIIGANSDVRAMCLVSHSLPEGSVAKGNPAIINAKKP